jgi:C4-type Zn-finger protein
MKIKELKQDNKRVQIIKQKNPIQNGYEYFLTVLTKDTFGNWVVNTDYKQKSEINSEAVALRIANVLLTNDI